MSTVMASRAASRPKDFPKKTTRTLRRDSNGLPQTLAIASGVSEIGHLPRRHCHCNAGFSRLRTEGDGVVERTSVENWPALLAGFAAFVLCVGAAALLLI